VINHETAVGRFFHLYAQKSSENDIPALVSQFTDPFISADPQGTHCVRVEDFAAALPRRKLLFDRLGSRPAVLTSLHETPLDARYVLAKTTWRFEFARENSGESEKVLADSTFLVDTGEEEFKIVMYMAHQDIMQVLRDRGILRD
jgi:hypothetical protein